MPFTTETIETTLAVLRNFSSWRDPGMSGDVLNFPENLPVLIKPDGSVIVKESKLELCHPIENMTDPADQEWAVWLQKNFNWEHQADK